MVALFQEVSKLITKKIYLLFHKKCYYFSVSEKITTDSNRRVFDVLKSKYGVLPLLVYLGQVPATALQFPSSGVGGQNLDDFIEKLKQSGFSVTCNGTSRFDKTSNVYCYDIHIAMEDADAEAHAKLCGGDGSKEYWIKEMGKLSGYPETAVGAYVEALQKKELSSLDGPLVRLNELKKCSRVYRFTLFRPSRAHIQDDLRTTRRWARAIRRFDPDFYYSLIGKKPPSKSPQSP